MADKNISLTLTILLAVFFSNQLFAQDNTTSTTNGPLQIVFPNASEWNNLDEGKEINFHLQTKGGKSDSIRYSISSGLRKEMKFDSTGHFVWTPGYEIADRINTVKMFPIIFEAVSLNGETATREVVFKVNHVNRATCD